MDVTIIGTGTVGSTVAYTLASELSGVSVRLTDTDEGKSQGHTIDIRHSTAHIAHSVGKQGKVNQNGGDTVEHISPGPDAVADSDCLVMTASAPRPEGASERGGRAKWLDTNLEIVEEVGEWLQSGDPCPVVVVTNPLDSITYELYRASGWPSHCFVGYSLSETARLADIMARKYGVSHEDVYCPVLGMHGEDMVPVFSRATVAGGAVDLDETQRQRFLDDMRDAPYEVINLRGADDSSRWVTGRGVSMLVRTLLSGGVVEPIGLSTPLDSAYGYEDVALSVPVTLDDAGVAEIVEWELSEQERSQLDDAYRSVASMRPE